MQLELFHKARIDKNGGPLLPKPIAFRQPSFVITSFRADLHRPPGNETHAARPSYVIKPFTAQLVEHEASVTADGQVAPGSLQVPLPGPVELSVAEGESVLEKVKSKLPLVLEAKSRRRHFSSANKQLPVNQTPSPAHSHGNKVVQEMSGRLFIDFLAAGKVVDDVEARYQEPSSDYSLPPYPISRRTMPAARHQIEPLRTTIKPEQLAATRRPQNTQVIRNLVQQLLEATRDFHSTEPSSETGQKELDYSAQVYFDQPAREDLVTSEQSSHSGLSFGHAGNDSVNAEETLPEPPAIQQSSHVTLVTIHDVHAPAHLTPLSPFVLESAGSREPVTTSQTTTEPATTDPATTMSQEPDMQELFNNSFAYQDRQSSPPFAEQTDRLETTTFQSDVQTTEIQLSESDYFNISRSPSSELEMMRNLTVQLSEGPVSMSTPYTGSRIFSSLGNNASLANATIEEALKFKETPAKPLPIEIGSAQFHSAVSDSLNDGQLESATYREQVVKIASLYIAELVANIMSLRQITRPVSADISPRDEHVATEHQPVTKVERIEANSGRSESLEERETSGLKNETAEIETRAGATGATAIPNVTRVGKTAIDPVAGRNNVFVVEAKTSYVFPTDTPVPSNEGQVHRQAYTVITGDEGDDSYEAPTDYPTPFQLMNSNGT